MTGGILAMAGAMAVLAARFALVRTAMISTGWGALIVGAGVAVGYLAEKMGAFGDASKSAAGDSAKITEEAAKGLVITHQRNQQALNLDESLAKQLGLQTAINDINMRSNGHMNIQMEIERAIVTERAKYLVTGESMSKQQEKAIADATRNKIISEEHMSIQKEMGDLQDRRTLALIDSGAELSIQTEMLKMQSKYSTETYLANRDEYRLLLQQTEQLETQAKLRDLMRTTPTQGEIATIGASAIQGTASGINVDFAKQANVLKQLNQERLLSDGEYANASILLERNRTDALIALDEKVMQARLKTAGVANDAITKSVTDQMANIKMASQGGVAGMQGVLGIMDNVASSMGTYNKQAFESHKKMATAMAIISTYQSIVTTMATVPFPFNIALAAAAGAAGFAQVAAIQSQQYSGRALGGPVQSGTSYIVGERGPEMFTPSSSGSITRNDQLGGQSVNVNFTIQANDASGFDSLLNSRKGMIKQLISDAMLEKGQRF
jgi:hypothetical protein